MLSFDLPRFLAGVLSAVPNAEDVLLAVGAPPQVRVEGALVRLELAGLERLSPFQTEAIALHLLARAPAGVAYRMRQSGAAHFAYPIPGVSRFRAAVFSQRGTFAVSLRAIPERVPVLDELGTPEAMREACQERHGIVLVSGPAGSGRTTSLAAMVAEVNASRSCHVVTVEDPIEFLHRHGKATINQREVGTDTPTLTQGLSDALRQGAQVLVSSDPQDAEQANLLLEAAETGHLVFTSVRGFDTASSLLRLLSLVPADARFEMRARLAHVLRFVFTQRLIPHLDGRRPVVEIWRATGSTVAHLAEGSLDSASFADLLREGEGDGLLALDRALELRVRGGEIEVGVALANAVVPRQLELRIMDLRGVS